MDIIDKIFNRIPKEKAPTSLRASILAIPEKQGAKMSFSWMKFLAPAMAVLLLVLGGGVYYRYFSVPKLASAFEITVDGQDAAGIAPNSVFVLKSSKDITSSQIKRVVKMYSAKDNSEVEFEVEGDGKNRFRIKPKNELSGNAIYKVSIAEGVAERDFAWAFQVRAPFGVISTFPRNQATGVPVNSSIEVTFNREQIENPEKYFSITPAVTGKYEVHNDTVLFVPTKPLAEKTIYTVTVAKGLTAKNSSENLATEIVFAFETSQTSYQPYSSFSLPEELVQFPTDRQPALQVYAYNTTLNNAQASVYAFSSKEDFVKAYYESRDWDLGWSYYYRQTGSGLANTEKLTRVSSFKPEIINFEYQSWLEIPDKLPAGYYVLDIQAGDIRRQAWILVNDISHYYTLTEQNGLVWAYGFSQKKPLSAATVAYYDASGVRHELAKTDQEGLAEFTVPEALKAGELNSPDYASPKLLEIQQSGQPASLALVSAGWWYSTAGNTQDDYWKYVSTERYTYKLADSVKFWGVLKGKSQDIRNQQVTVQLREGYYYYGNYSMPGYVNQDRPLAETQTTISQFDTFSGKLDFKGAKPGTYNLVVLHNGKVITQTSVEILNYSKPLYHITVTPSKPVVFTGEPVDFLVKAEFYDGTPVGQLALKYTGYYNREISGQVTLNAKGEGKVTITPEYFESNYYPYTLSLSFYPDLAEEGEIMSESTGSALVFGPRVYLQASQKYNDNNSFSITAKTNFITINSEPTNRDSAGILPEYIDKAAPGVELTAEIEKTEYLKIDAGTAYDPINKISVPQYKYEEKKTIVQQIRSVTNGSGEWVFNTELPKVERGFYQIRISGTDGGGRKLSATLWPYYYRNYEGFYYSGSTSNSNRVVLSLGFEGGTERDYNRQFSVGEQVPLKAEILDGKQLVSGKTLYYRYGHSGLGEIKLTGEDTWQDKFGKDYKPAVSYRAVVFGPYGFVESNSLFAAYKQSDAKLNIEISPDKANYRPGDTATIGVSVKDKDGKIHDGEVNLSVVDEAVFDVVPYYWQQDILQSLYAVDYSEPRSGASDFTPPAFQQGEGAEGGGCFLPDTLIQLPGGVTKRIDEIKVGDTVLAKASEKTGAPLVSAIVQGISRHEVGSYLIINKHLKVTEEHKLFVNGAWLMAGYVKAGDSLVGVDGKAVSVISVEKVIAPKTMVHNINVGKYHTYFAGGLYVHNAEKGGGYRSEFLDTAYFENKALESGKAEFKVKLPDNITSWRATASAFGPGNILAGQEHKQLPASLPFFVDAVISETYLTGDKPTVAIRTFGTEANNGASTQYWVDIDAINYHESQTLIGGSVDYVLPTLPAGIYELKIRAKQNNFEDGIIRKFSVVSSYFLSKSSKLTELTSGQIGMVGNSNSYTDVTFADMGRAQFYNELLWNSYQGGKRSDQVTAAYLASRMLKENFGGMEDVPNLDLSSYHVPEGGLGLFTYGDSDLVLSAQLADVAPEFVYQPQLIEYFRDQMRGNQADIHRIAASLYGLASLNQPVLSKLQLISDEKDLTLEDKMYIALALAKLGDKEGARKLYEQSIMPELRKEGGRAWISNEQDESKKNKLTTLAGAVAASVGKHDDALQIWAYAKEHYPTKTLDILERMIIIREEIGRLNSEPAEFSYEVNGKAVKVTLEQGRFSTVRFWADEINQVKINDVKGKPVAISVINEYKNPEALTKNSELQIKRSYWVNGKQTTVFEEGSTVVVRFEYTIDKNAIDGGYQVVDYLPSGLKPISNVWQRGLSYNWEQCSQRGFPLSVEGNAVYFSAYHPGSETGRCHQYTIEYYARAAGKGEFNANPALLQSLTNYESLNVSASEKVRVTPPGNSSRPIVLPKQ